MAQDVPNTYAVEGDVRRVYQGSEEDRDRIFETAKLDQNKRKTILHPQVPSAGVECRERCQSAGTSSSRMRRRRRIRRAEAAGMEQAAPFL